jgi:hypothetical protein
MSYIIKMSGQNNAAKMNGTAYQQEMSNGEKDGTANPQKHLKDDEKRIQVQQAGSTTIEAESSTQADESEWDVISDGDVYEARCTLPNHLLRHVGFAELKVGSKRWRKEFYKAP